MTLLALVLVWMLLSTLAALGTTALCRAGHDEDVRLGFLTDDEARY